MKFGIATFFTEIEVFTPIPDFPTNKICTN